MENEKYFERKMRMKKRRKNQISAAGQRTGGDNGESNT